MALRGRTVQRLTQRPSSYASSSDHHTSSYHSHSCSASIAPPPHPSAAPLCSPLPVLHHCASMFRVPVSVALLCLSLLSACGLPSSLAQPSYVPFTAVTLAAPFQTRSEASVTSTPQAVQYVDALSLQPVTAPAGSLIIWGGVSDAPSPYSQFVNDCWLSADGGASWAIISGVSSYNASQAVSAFSTSSVMYGDLGQAQCASRITGELYGFGGQDTAIAQQYWSTDGGVQWRNSSSESWQRMNDALCLVDPHIPNRLLLMGGDLYGGGPSNQTWLSQDGGVTWSEQPVASWDARAGMAGAAVYSAQLNTTIFYLMAGNHPGSTRLGTNDVWCSSDLQSWWQLTAAAPFPIRTHARATSTTAGIIILTEGAEDETAADSVYPHDVWASMDGGWTWGQCSSAATAAYPARRNHGLTLDSDGYLIIMMGEDTDYTDNVESKYNDVWQSAISFNDVDAVASACGLPQPAAPSCVGPRCWPIGSDCPCVLPSSSSSSAVIPPPPVTSSTSSTLTLQSSSSLTEVSLPSSSSAAVSSSPASPPVSSSAAAASSSTSIPPSAATSTFSSAAITLPFSTVQSSAAPTASSSASASSPTSSSSASPLPSSSVRSSSSTPPSSLASSSAAPVSAVQSSASAVPSSASAVQSSASSAATGSMSSSQPTVSSSSSSSPFASLVSSLSSLLSTQSSAASSSSAGSVVVASSGSSSSPASTGSTTASSTQSSSGSSSTAPASSASSSSSLLSTVQQQRSASSLSSSSQLASSLSASSSTASSSSSAVGPSSSSSAAIASSVSSSSSPSVLPPAAASSSSSAEFSASSASSSASMVNSSTVFVSSSSSALLAPPGSSAGGGGLSAGAIAGIVIGGVVAALLCICIACYCCVCPKRDDNEDKDPALAPAAHPAPTLPPRPVLAAAGSQLAAPAASGYRPYHNSYSSTSVTTGQPFGTADSIATDSSIDSEKINRSVVYVH